MADSISDATIEYVAALARLELLGEEKERARQDMERMLAYVDHLNELDTSEAEPLCHVIPVQNVVREDAVVNGDESQMLLQNASCRKDNMFDAPRAF